MRSVEMFGQRIGAQRARRADRRGHRRGGARRRPHGDRFSSGPATRGSPTSALDVELKLDPSAPRRWPRVRGSRSPRHGRGAGPGPSPIEHRSRRARTRAARPGGAGGGSRGRPPGHPELQPGHDHRRGRGPRPHPACAPRRLAHRALGIGTCGAAPRVVESAAGRRGARDAAAAAGQTAQGGRRGGPRARRRARGGRHLAARRRGAGAGHQGPGAGCGASTGRSPASGGCRSRRYATLSAPPRRSSRPRSAILPGRAGSGSATGSWRSPALRPRSKAVMRRWIASSAFWSRPRSARPAWPTRGDHRAPGPGITPSAGGRQWPR